MKIKVTKTIIDKLFKGVSVLDLKKQEHRKLAGELLILAYGQGIDKDKGPEDYNLVAAVSEIEKNGFESNFSLLVGIFTESEKQQFGELFVNRYLERLADDMLSK